MSKITRGQVFPRKIAEILNNEFGATNKSGLQLGGARHSVWPWSAPFLVNVKSKQRKKTVVWFPVVVNNANANVKGDWLNVANGNQTIIKTTYIGSKPLADVENLAAQFIDMDHIVFARCGKKHAAYEFYGVYSCVKRGNVRTFTRIADRIDTADWQRR